ncbi:hypothetical protein [Pseudomonas sp. GM78]|uniref:hypothetical protein n=1 Tax=Pseudomonas sp. GM78 TaxID=1144337 RepID=UPI0012F7A3A5|nr:hypothetical protein [Pseudomonas sp. GM78]
MKNNQNTQNDLKRRFLTLEPGTEKTPGSRPGDQAFSAFSRKHAKANFSCNERRPAYLVFNYIDPGQTHAQAQ